MLRQSRRALCGAAAAILLSCAPLYSATAAAAVAPEAEYSVLEPGDFVWEPNASADGPVEVVVSLPLQVAYVYRGGTLIGVSTVSTGKPGHETPPGSFEILQKREEHYSNKYNNAPMPFMQRLTWSGVALHGGKIPGHPASHGCIRLPNKFAQHLYGVTDLGAWVHIVEATVTPDQAMAYLRETPTGYQLASAGD